MVSNKHRRMIRLVVGLFIKEFTRWIHHPVFDNCVLALPQNMKEKWKPRNNEIMKAD